MTSAKFSDFFTPSPLVTDTLAQLIITVVYLLFGGPISQCKHHMYMPPKNEIGGCAVGGIRNKCDL